jgi:hypothetical protein
MTGNRKAAILGVAAALLVGLVAVAPAIYRKAVVSHPGPNGIACQRGCNGDATRIGMIGTGGAGWEVNPPWARFCAWYGEAHRNGSRNPRQRSLGRNRLLG